MLSEELAFNLKLTHHLCLYRYPLWDEEGTGIDMTWCVIIDNDAIERKGDNYPIHEVPDGRMMLLDEFVWGHSWSSCDTVVGGSVGRVTVDGQYHITINAASRSLETMHVPLRRPIPYFSGEWIAACPHLLGKAERSAFRLTLRFREMPMPDSAHAGEMEELVRMES